MLRSCITGLIATGVLAPAAAGAADDSAFGDSAFYAGLGAGEAHNETGDFRLDGPVAKAFAGYAFNDYFAAEIAYVDPQEADDTIGDARVALDVKGVIASTVLSAPLFESWSIFGKLGWAFYDGRETVEIGGVRAAASASDDDFAWGVGTAMRIGSRWSMRLEYERVEVSEGAFKALTMSGTVRF
jgi:OmpA-OmpF porin, OOP family